MDTFTKSCTDLEKSIEPERKTIVHIITEGKNEKVSVDTKKQSNFNDTTDVQEENDSLLKPEVEIIDDIKHSVNITKCTEINNQHEIEVNKQIDNANTEEKVEDNVVELIDMEISSEDHDKTKNLKADTTTETIINGNNNAKRKLRNLSIQEKDPVSEESGIRNKRKKFKDANDRFCWRCHKESVETHCSACPRSWHRKCMGGTPPLSLHNWICGECATILKAENAETRSIAMSQLSVDQLCMLLKHVVERMRDYPGSEPFWKPVEISEAPNYLDYVVKPMDLYLLESNVRAKLYGSTDAFMADAKWIQHNCIVFNTCGGVYTDTSKLTNAAKQVIKVARQEVSEIEACPDCYAHGRNLPRPQPAWFVEPCYRPHPLVWAKLKGFPFWPAKAMPRVNSQGFVDVRFFGAHDRAWVSPRDLYLYSQDPPAPLPRKRKPDMDECVREITRHCRKLELVFGKFKFAPPKVQYDPHDPMQIKLMLPNYDPLHSNSSLNSQFSPSKKKIIIRKRGSPIKVKSHSNNLLMDTDNDTPVTDVNVECVQSKDGHKTAKVHQLHVSGEPKLVLNSQRRYGSKAQNKLQKFQLKEARNSLQQNKAIVRQDNENIKLTENRIDKVNSDTNAEESLIKLNNKLTVSDITDVSSHVTKPFDNLLKCQVTNPSIDTSQIQTKGITLKSCANKVDISPNSIVVQKSTSKSTKILDKAYKPKTRIVDKMNAEKAQKFVLDKKKNDNSESLASNLDEGTNKITLVSNDLFNKTNSSTSSNSLLLSPLCSNSDNKLQINNIDSRNTSVKTVQCSATNSTTEQSVALFLVVNNGKNEITKQSTPILLTDSPQNSNIFTVKKQESTGTQQTSYQNKESKARKSFPNRFPNQSQITSHSSSNVSTKSNDPITSHIPTTFTETTGTYQLPPPEAGPLSARLYHGAQELAKKMAQLMEEAYKEAAQASDNKEDELETHQGTVHFLKLQIERMRWQHQQQLAELKHNTDRILREMKASLEAERLRAIEETRKEAEEERKRCIEEIKRKQWCAMCGREALFYCCWNTAYCDYPCQQSHWPIHMRTCAQQSSFITNSTSSAANSNQQQVMPRLVINTQRTTANLWKA